MTEFGWACFGNEPMSILTKENVLKNCRINDSNSLEGAMKEIRKKVKGTQVHISNQYIDENEVILKDHEANDYVLNFLRSNSANKP